MAAAPTVTFVVGSYTAIPWLERAATGCKCGDVLHATDAEGVVVYTVVVRHVELRTNTPTPEAKCAVVKGEANVTAGSNETTAVEASQETKASMSSSAVVSSTSSASTNVAGTTGRTVEATNVDSASYMKDPVAFADAYRLVGNEKLTGSGTKRMDMREAILKYNSALYALMELPDFASRSVPLRLNIALAHLRLSEWACAMRHCDAVLSIEPNNAKALFRRGRALFELGSFQLAITDLRAAKRLCATDAMITQMLDKAINVSYRNVQKDRQLFAQTYAQMISGRPFEKQSA